MIMATLLCIFGSFTFIFSSLYSNSPDLINNVEKYTYIDIPQHEKIVTEESSDYRKSNIIFLQENVENFEATLINDGRWLSILPSKLECLLHFADKYAIYDYIMIYNIDTDQYNTLPDESGTYHFISLYYSVKTNGLTIVEYDMEYTE